MTAKELIDKLRTVDPNAVVVYTDPQFPTQLFNVNTIEPRAYTYRKYAESIFKMDTLTYNTYAGESKDIPVVFII